VPVFFNYVITENKIFKLFQLLDLQMSSVMRQITGTGLLNVWIECKIQ
jgi:hypothetical protein